jgi:hypothetical protein
LECGDKVAALARLLAPHQRTSQSGGFATALQINANKKGGLFGRLFVARAKSD